ncbi:MAG: hypothetical protein OEL79_11130, partial [Chromatiales bacterium]|nr:hypothetical protein [Chromatiales bacterium]
MEHLIRRILERPALAAILVGTFINLFMMVTTWAMAGTEILMVRFSLLKSAPLYFAIQIAIPYLIPWAVTSISLRASRQRMQLILNKFPEMNPDIIMRLDQDLGVEYINQAGQAFMQHHQMPSEDPLQMLPEHALKRLREDSSDDLWLSVDVRHNEQAINFVIRRDNEGSIFIAGRDITRAKKMQDRLDSVTSQLSQLTAFLDRSLADYNPLNFDLFGHIELMLNELMDSDPEQKLASPKSVLVMQQDNNSLTGHLYHLRENGVFQDKELISLDTEYYPFAKTSHHDEMICVNWKESQQSLNSFQQRFSPKIREKVGTIKGYTVYQSGSTEVIGFFNRNNIDYYEGMVLESAAIISESFNRISQESMQIQESFIYTLD